MFLSAAPEVPKRSPIQAQSCLTSVSEWELVFPTWHGPLTQRLLFTLIVLEASRVELELGLACRALSQQYVCKVINHLFYWLNLSWV